MDAKVIQCIKHNIINLRLNECCKQFMKIENLYLIRLFYAQKSLFIIALLFIFLSFSANFIFRSEQTPIFKWDLYSKAMPFLSTYSFLEVRYNQNELLKFPHTWQEPKKLFFTNTLDYFIAIKRNNNIDPYKNYFANNWSKRHVRLKELFGSINLYNDTTEINAFPAWYKKYLEQYIQQNVWSINVYEKKVEFINGGVNEISSSLIYKLL